MNNFTVESQLTMKNFQLKEATLFFRIYLKDF